MAKWAWGTPEIEAISIYSTLGFTGLPKSRSRHRAVQFCTDFLHEASSVLFSHHPLDQPGNRDISAHYPGPLVFSPRIFWLKPSSFSCLCQPNADLLHGQLKNMNYTFGEKRNNSERNKNFLPFLRFYHRFSSVQVYICLQKQLVVLYTLQALCLVVIFLLGISLSLFLSKCYLYILPKL